MEDNFIGFTEETIMIWESLLINSNTNYTCYLIQDDGIILNNYIETEPNLKIIKNDSKRTRTKDSYLLNSFHLYLESILSFYCKINKVVYKQGLNEILAPFLLLKSKFNLSLSRVYNIFSCFIERFLISYFADKEFQSLQLALNLINVLLKYHDPLVYHLFDISLITPEMYGTSWLLTCFASKCNLNVIYCLLDLIIKENDEYFMLFFIVAFLSFNKVYYSVKDLSYLPSILSSLSIKNTQECQNIYELACKIRSNTPFSFRMYSNNRGLFNGKNHISIQVKDKDDIFNCMPIMPSEFLYLINKIKCCNILCKNTNTPCSFTNCLYKGQNIENTYDIISLFDKTNLNYTIYSKYKYLIKENVDKFIIIDIRIEDDNLYISGDDILRFTYDELVDINVSTK